jgi:hypothetical protein
MARTSILLTVVFLFLSFLTACNFINAEPTPTPGYPTPLPITPFPPTAPADNLEPTAPLPTISQVTPQLPSETPTLDNSTPTASPPLATITLPTGATRLTMGAGRTAVSADGSLAASNSVTYVVSAVAGQYIMANLISTNQTLYVQVRSPDGALLVSSAAKKNSWQGSLPLSGDYLVSAVSSGTAGSYKLAITIPARVVFDAGSVTTSMNATVGANGTTAFIMRALEGQTLSVKIISTVGDVFLDIYGLEDGTSYIRPVPGQTSYSFKLPSTQEYIIQCVNSGNRSEDLIVTFKAQ